MLTTRQHRDGHAEGNQEDAEISYSFNNFSQRRCAERWVQRYGLAGRPPLLWWLLVTPTSAWF